MCDGEVGSVDTLTIERVIVQGKREPAEQKIYVPFNETTSSTNATDNILDVNIEYQDHFKSNNINDEAAAPV